MRMGFPCDIRIWITGSLGKKRDVIKHLLLHQKVLICMFRAMNWKNSTLWPFIMAKKHKYLIFLPSQGKVYL